MQHGMVLSSFTLILDLREDFLLLSKSLSDGTNDLRCAALKVGDVS